jgi:HTH-type transcriptional regulator/antitoxin HigA
MKATRKTNLKSRRTAPADYMALVARFPLGLLTSEVHYNAAWKVAEPMTGRTDLTPGEQMYLDALSFFLEQYEQEHHAIKRPKNLTPATMLKELMEFRNMTVNDLGKIVGSQSLASMILAGKRGISKSNIARLAAHFRVDPAVFIEPASIGLRRPTQQPRRAAG